MSIASYEQNEALLDLYKKLDVAEREASTRDGMISGPRGTLIAMVMFFSHPFNLLLNGMLQGVIVNDCDV